VFLDVFGGLVVAWLLLGNSLFTLPILAAIAGGNAPDVLQTLWDRLSRQQQQATPWADRLSTWHDQLQYETSSLLRGLISQAILIALALVLILRY